MGARQQTIERVAREALGFAALRPGQLEAVESVLEGRDTVAVLSTGSGKSAIYQIAGLLLPGATLVVSPLIALQRDQVQRLREGAFGAALLNSTVAERQREAALADLADDALEFLFLAPEQLANADVLAELAATPPSLIVVDEAHCISEWGHDFRPDYLRLGAAVEALGHPRVLALTATAAPPVRDEIVQRLGLRDPAVVVRGFDRPNIDMGVERLYDEHRKRRAVREHVAQLGGAGIVYAATRRRAEELTAELQAAGSRARAYHAGLARSEREAAQEAFMDDEVEVIVATTAFGMGIDKRDVRWVLHADVPGSVDAYYQELGRAGRDGEPAQAILLYRSEDFGLRRFFASGGQLDAEELEAVADALDVPDEALSLERLSERTGLSHSRLAAALSRLEDAGAIVVAADGTVVRPPDAVPIEHALTRALEADERRHELARSRVEMMRAYAETDGCRREFLLSYFGEPFAAPCGACDNCRAGRVTAEVVDRPYPVGAHVVHRRWGDGVVQRYDDDAVVVLFDAVGYKTLALEVVRERGILTPAEAA